MEFSEKPSLRDKKSGLIYRLGKNIERRIDREYDAEQAKTPIKVESESEDEQANGISTNTDGSLLTSLKMTCSDNEDPFEDCDNTSQATERPANAVVMPSCGIENASISKALGSISRQMALMVDKISKIDKKTDNMQKDMANILDRLGRVEKKMGVSLSTLEQVKDSVVTMGAEGSRTEGCCLPGFHFTFKKISTEEEFTEFCTKLGADEEYYSNVKKWLLMQLPDSNPNHRMHLAMDILMERSFFAQCNWSGHGRNEPKVCFGNRTEMFKLFADIGSNKFVTMTEVLVQSFFRKKLDHAKERAKTKSMTSRVILRRKTPHASSS
ncbi:uncharacterized protein LOC118509028 isoform X1 [Anopheles stephensi]|uniref:uncharacterized protein LOC118509028 isoform X1 n=1 Tax=Anopheles stephensi TaxID=30069 RepID=UPI0016588526|nr:uncharacterized protein LOC118509028 isoform X1 [Anopheles stephensi]